MGSDPCFPFIVKVGAATGKYVPLSVGHGCNKPPVVIERENRVPLFIQQPLSERHALSIQVPDFVVFDSQANREKLVCLPSD